MRPTVDVGVPGVRVGHWTDARARTGCTVLLFPDGTVASGEVRGGAPATREFALLAPEMLVDRIDAVVLTGGSAFGLASADGVVRWLARRGSGFPTGAGPVPIVVALGLFDLLVGDRDVHPGPDEGIAAAEAAAPGPIPLGAVGAGTGATVGKWRGRDAARPGGLVGASVAAGDVVVTALAAVNAFGDPGAAVEVGAVDVDAAGPSGSGAFGNTTVGVVVSNARLGKTDCLLVAQGAHDGLARAVAPVHTRVDGDAFVAAATGAIEAPVDLVRTLAVAAVERAVLSLSTSA